MKLVMVPHNRHSRSAKALAAVLSEKVGHKVYRVTPEKVGKRIPFVLREGTDKLTQLQRFLENGIACPDFCSDPTTAREWASQDLVVVCRTLLRGSEGRGIVLASTPDEVVAAPLYTKYVKKKKEFRVHVLNGEVIDVQEKRKRSGFEGERDVRVRNVANGYVFCRNDVEEPDGLRPLATQAVQALGYFLGAVDVCYNERGNALYVLEVNSTPGMEGTTLDNYATAINNWYRNQLG